MVILILIGLVAIGAPVTAFLIFRLLTVGFVQTLLLVKLVISAVFGAVTLGFFGWLIAGSTNEQNAPLGAFLGALTGIVLAYLTRTRMEIPLKAMVEVPEGIEAGPSDYLIASTVASSVGFIASAIDVSNQQSQDKSSRKLN
jgi:hypothetical protein